MSDQQFDIIFRGDIVFGHQLADVKAKLQNLFKADAAKIDALFSGRPVPLKRGLDQASALKYKDALIKAGAQVDLVAVGDTKPAPVAQPAERTLSLAQRLQQQAAAEKEAAEKVVLQKEQAARETASHTPEIMNNKTDWSLAPVGSYLLKPTEKAVVEPVEVDISAISLRPEGGNILDASEQPQAPHAQVVAPNFEIAAVGTDLIRADEKMELPLLELELADWTLADLGEDLISQSEKASVSVQAIHIPDVGLAPPGADLGQLKPQVKAVTPDISGIRLAD
ncbi:MAG: hypothetical protein EOO52_13840 [Gammaproteobacteria bacterium]|nr:MAG: hypothetical protein EOO52_13840 [Gammaproteobacteria bacterium]